jgi:hypothetical protein
MARFRDLCVFRLHAASVGLAPLEGLAKNAPVAQLDRALDYESRGQEFESLRARQIVTVQPSRAPQRDERARQGALPARPVERLPEV